MIYILVFSREREEEMKGNPFFEEPALAPRPSVRVQNNNAPPALATQYQSPRPMAAPVPAPTQRPYEYSR